MPLPTGTSGSSRRLSARRENALHKQVAVVIEIPPSFGLRNKGNLRVSWGERRRA